MSDTLARLDARIAELQAARKVFLELDGEPLLERVVPESKSTIRRLNGTQQVLFDVIKGGAETPAHIIKAAKVSAYIARKALKELTKAGRVVRDGNTISTRYRIAR